MANTIRVKRSSVDGRIPTITDLELGEIAINTYMGKMFIKQKRGLVESIVQIGAENIFTYANVAPSNPLNGDMWMEETTNLLSIYVEGTGWELVVGIQGYSGKLTVGPTPPPSPSLNDLWIDTN